MAKTFQSYRFSMKGVLVFFFLISVLLAILIPPIEKRIRINKAYAYLCRVGITHDFIESGDQTKLTYVSFVGCVCGTEVLPYLEVFETLEEIDLAGCFKFDTNLAVKYPIAARAVANHYKKVVQNATLGYFEPVTFDQFVTDLELGIPFGVPFSNDVACKSKLVRLIPAGNKPLKEWLDEFNSSMGVDYSVDSSGVRLFESGRRKRSRR